MGVISRANISVLEDDSLSLSKDITLVAPHLEEALFEELLW